MSNYTMHTHWQQNMVFITFFQSGKICLLLESCKTLRSKFVGYLNIEKKEKKDYSHILMLENILCHIISETKSSCIHIPIPAVHPVLTCLGSDPAPQLRLGTWQKSMNLYVFPVGSFIK